MSEPDTTSSGQQETSTPSTAPACPPLPAAWQPFTPRGVAAFSKAGLGRILVLELFVALLGAASLCCLVDLTWFPVIKQAIRNLPASGEIANGRLQWTNSTPVLLASGSRLAIVVDLDETGALGMASDFQIEFGRDKWHVRGLLGALSFPYPKTGTAPFNQTELVPWWGAWSQAILAGLAVFTVTILLVTWAFIASLLTAPAKLITYLANLELAWPGAWKLASAALMPGAFLMTLAVLAYAWSFMDLVQLGFVAIFHLAADLVYLFFGALCLPPKPETIIPKTNPFATEPQEGKSKENNPFSQA